MKRLAYAAACLLLFTACAKDSTIDARTSGESHWLEVCASDDECGDGLCVCGVCTIECDADDACANLQGAAGCGESACGAALVCLPAQSPDVGVMPDAAQPDVAENPDVGRDAALDGPQPPDGPALDALVDGPLPDVALPDDARVDGPPPDVDLPPDPHACEDDLDCFGCQGLEEDCACPDAAVNRDHPEACVFLCVPEEICGAPPGRQTRCVGGRCEWSGCESDDECGDGHVCDDGRCERVCNHDVDCGEGRTCVQDCDDDCDQREFPNRCCERFCLDRDPRPRWACDQIGACVADGAACPDDLTAARDFGPDSALWSCPCCLPDDCEVITFHRACEEQPECRWEPDDCGGGFCPGPNQGLCVEDRGPGRDRDGDGVPDVNDNCPDLASPNHADSDGDGIGDACDQLCNLDGEDVVCLEAFECPEGMVATAENGCFGCCLVWAGCPVASADRDGDRMCDVAQEYCGAFGDEQCDADPPLCEQGGVPAVDGAGFCWANDGCVLATACACPDGACAR